MSFLLRLRNAEHSDLHNNIISQIGLLNLNPVNIIAAWNAYRQAFRKENAIYMRYTNKFNTRRIKETHKQRRMAYMALKRTIEAGAYSILPPVKEAAETLMLILDNYSGIYRAPMTEASALITNMIKDMKSPQYAAAIALVAGTENTIGLLEQQNQIFIELYAERSSNEEDMRNEGRLFDARLQTDRAFALFVELVNAFYRANEMMHPKKPEVSAVLGDVIHHVNALIHRYEAIYSRRSPKYRPADDEDPVAADDERPA
jgi:hypothetical protein